MTIYLSDRRWVAVDLVKKLQHVTAGVPMLMVGLGNFAHEAERPKAVLEIAVALGVFATYAKEVYAARKHSASHSRVGWFDLAAGVLLIFEAFFGHHPHPNYPGYVRPQFLAGVSTLGVGLFDARLHAFRKRRRYLKLDETGLQFRAARFWRFSLAWADLASVDLAGSKAIFYRNNGRRRAFRLDTLQNRDEVRKGIADHARAAGVPVETVS